MKGIANIGLILAVLVVGLAISAGRTQTIYLPTDFGKCGIDASKSFSPIPEKVLVALPDFNDAGKAYKLANLEGKTFTVTSLRSEIVNYISLKCEPVNSDWCVNQKGRAIAAISNNYPIGLSSNLIAQSDGVYWGDKKVLQQNQQFKVILPEGHPEGIIAVTGLFTLSGDGQQFNFNNEYIGGLYGVSAGTSFSCSANYGIDPTLPRLDSPTTAPTTTTTTLPPVSYTPSPVQGIRIFDSITAFINGLISQIRLLLRI